jgi:hypothetical protein
MLAVLMKKIIVVCEPLISLIQDQIKQLPTTIRAVHYRGSDQSVIDQIKNSEIDIGMHPFVVIYHVLILLVYLAPESCSDFIKRLKVYSSNFGFFVGKLFFGIVLLTLFVSYI